MSLISKASHKRTWRQTLRARTGSYYADLKPCDATARAIKRKVKFDGAQPLSIAVPRQRTEAGPHRQISCRAIITMPITDTAQASVRSQGMPIQ